MPTLREYIASLPPEEQAAAMDQLLRTQAYNKRINESPVVGRLEALGEGAAAGLGNALKGLVTSPLAITNAIGLTSSDLPSKPLLGPGGDFASDPSLGLGVGPFYGTGNVLGFAASFLGGGGEAKVGASIVRRAVEGAAHLAAGTALRSQGTLQDRIVAGVEAAPLGAAFGVAAAPRAAGEGLGKHIFKTAVKSGVAGAVVPAHSPVDATGVPAVDNFLFNAAFGAAASVRAKEPRVPGREPAQNSERTIEATHAELRARAGDMQRTVEEQASIESAVATQFPNLPKEAPPFKPMTTAGLDLPMEAGTLIPDEAQKALFEQAQAAIPETKPEDIFPASKTNQNLKQAGVTFVRMVSGLRAFRKQQDHPARAEFEQTLKDDLANTPAGIWQTPNFHVSIAAPASLKNIGAMLSNTNAMFSPTENTLTVFPKYFAIKDPAIRRSILVHEGSHEVSLMRGLLKAAPDKVAQLYRQLNFPVVDVPPAKFNWENIVPELARQVGSLYNFERVTGLLPQKTGLDYILQGIAKDGTQLSIPFHISSLHGVIEPFHYGKQMPQAIREHDVYFAYPSNDTLIKTEKWLKAPEVNGQHYAYSHPSEMIAELAGSLASGDNLRNNPAALELLDRTTGSRSNSFVLGVSNRNNLKQQRSLFPDTFAHNILEQPGPLGGPSLIKSLTWTDVATAQNSIQTTEAIRRSESEKDRPWSLAAATQKGTGASARTQAEHAAENAAGNYTYRMNRQGPAKKSGAFEEIKSRFHDMIIERAQEQDRLNPPVAEGEPGSQRQSVTLKDLERLIKFQDAKPIIEEEMAKAALQAQSLGVSPEGTERTIEDLADPGEIDYGKYAAAAIPKKIKRVVSNTEFAAQFKERIDPVKEERLKGLFTQGLAGVMANRAIDRTMKEILIRRYGAGFSNPDGSPVHPQQESIASIARKLGTTERNVRARIQAFAGTGKSDTRLTARTAGVDLKQPELFEGVRPAQDVRPQDLPGPSNNLIRGGTLIPTDDPTYDYVAWKHQVTQVDRATGEPVAISKTSRRGTGRATITDLKTGEKYVQQGLFDDRRAAYAEADREAAVPEPAAGPPPEPISQQEKVMEGAVAEAEAGPIAAAALKGQEAAERKAQRGGIAPEQPELAALFGDVKGAIKPTSRLGEILTFDKARARIGSSAMTPDQFASLHIDQQLRHVILRLSNAANTAHYTKTLAKYAKLLNASATENGARIQFPTLTKLVEASKAAKKGSPRIGWMAVINDRATELGVSVDQVNPESGSGAKLRLTEPETGRQIVTRDVGTAALFLDARSRRIAEAVDLMPPGFSHLRIYLDPLGGAPFGPPPPKDTPSAPDAEGSGRPPDMPSGAERSFGDAFFSQVRPVLNHAAHLARKLGYNEIALSTRNLMDNMEIGRNQAQRTIEHRVKLAKAFGISARRQTVLGKAAADLDIAGENELKATKDLNKAIARMDAIQDSVYEAHGLTSNEIQFLKKMRPEWDRMFRLFNIGVTKYIPGYFTRWGRRDPENGTVVLNATHTTDVNFFARQYRKGHLRGQNYNYFEVFDHYARQGFREKHVGVSPGSGLLSPVERLDSVLQRYALRSVSGQTVPWVDLTDDAGTATGRIAKQFDPLVRLIDVARGIPDSRRLNAIEAQAGITKRLYDITDEKTQAAIDRAFVPFRKELKATVKAMHESLGVKLSERTYDTWLDVYTRLSRGRTFGLSFGRALRNMITDGPFSVLPRVGPKYYAQAIADVLNPSLGPQIYRRVTALGVIKPSFVTEYISTTNKALTAIEKLSFMFSLSDHWGRAVAFRAQELKTRDATISYSRHGDIEKFKHDSGLTLLDPAWHDLITDHVKRGNYQLAIREHAKLLSDVALFDYTNANAPIAFRGVWGRFLGQYAIWPINMVESLHGMVKWGTREERLKQAALYAASAAAVYGAGTAIGVKTSQWIPFVHNVFYTGGPGLGLAEETREALAGDPATQQRLLSDLHHDPVAFFLGAVTKNILPAGDVLRVFAAQTNMSRRRRRLLGIPRPESSPDARIKRLLGFVPASAPQPKTQPLVQRAMSALTEKLP